MIRGSISCTARALHTIPNELFRKEKLSEIPKLPDSIVSTIGKYFTNLRDLQKLGEIRNIIAFEDIHDVIALTGTSGSRYFYITPEEYRESKSCTFSNQRLSSKEHDVLEKMRREMMKTWQFTAKSTLPLSQPTLNIKDYLNDSFAYSCKRGLINGLKPDEAKMYTTKELTVEMAFAVPPLKGKNWDIAVNVEIPK